MKLLRSLVGLAILAGGMESGALVAPLFAQGAAAVAQPAAAPEQLIDPRAAAALDEVTARYRRERSFSIVGINEKLGGTATTYSRTETTVQYPLRARLKVNRIDQKGRIDVPLTRRLIGSKSYETWDLVSREYKPNYSQFRPLDSEKDRTTAWSDISQPNPELGYSLFSFVAGANPAKSNSVVKASRYVEKHGGQEFERIFVLRRQRGDADTDLLEFLIASATHDLREFVLRQHVGDKDFVTTTRFSPLVPNWKEPQEALDTEVYSWKTIAIPGVDEPAPRPAPVVHIDPKATELFARTAGLYSGLTALQMAWREEVSDPKISDKHTAMVKIAWEQRGRLRLEDSDGMDQLVVIGPKTKSRVDSSGVIYGEKAKYKIEKFGPEQAELTASEALEWGGAHITVLAKWMDGTNILDAAEVKTTVDAEELFEMRATVLAPQPFEGLPCDIVQITKRYDDKYTLAKGETVKTEKYWFAQADGRLVRVQTDSVEGKEKPYAADMKVTAQDLKPVFPESMFTFTPPKGAVLDGD